MKNKVFRKNYCCTLQIIALVVFSVDCLGNTASQNLIQELCQHIHKEKIILPEGQRQLQNLRVSDIWKMKFSLKENFSIEVIADQPKERNTHTYQKKFLVFSLGSPYLATQEDEEILHNAKFAKLFLERTYKKLKDSINVDGCIEEADRIWITQEILASKLKEIHQGEKIKKLKSADAVYNYIKKITEHDPEISVYFNMSHSEMLKTVKQFSAKNPQEYFHIVLISHGEKGVLYDSIGIIENRFFSALSKVPNLISVNPFSCFSKDFTKFYRFGSKDLLMSGKTLTFPKLMNSLSQYDLIPLDAFPLFMSELKNHWN
jgi:hypothetical protein